MPPPIELQAECQKLASGFFGSAVSLILHPRHGVWMGALHLVCGTLVAHYLGPALSDFSRVGLPVASFLSGLFGLAVLRKASDMLEFFDARSAISDLWGAIMDRIRGK